MASDKEQMMSSANYYAGLVTAAKNTCHDVFLNLTTPVNEVERYWKGAAGEQMAQSLESARQRIRTLYDRLNYVETQMKSQADNIYNTWPESEDEV